MTTSIDAAIRSRDADLRAAKLVRKHFPGATMGAVGKYNDPVFVAPDGAWATEVTCLPVWESCVEVVVVYRTRTLVEGDLRVVVYAGPLDKTAVRLDALLAQLKDDAPEALAAVVATMERLAR